METKPRGRAVVLAKEKVFGVRQDLGLAVHKLGDSNSGYCEQKAHRASARSELDDISPLN